MMEWPATSAGAELTSEFERQSSGGGRRANGKHGKRKPPRVSEGSYWSGSLCAGPSETRGGLRFRCFSCALLRRQLDCRSNSLVSSAPADVAGHSIINILVRRMRLALQQRNRLHDLPGLAISALRRIHLNPRFLDGMQS